MSAGSAELNRVLERLSEIESVLDEIRQLVGPFGVGFPNDKMLVQTIHGVKYFIDALDDVMTPQLVVYRQWEDELTRFILNSVNKDTVFLDVGANFGYFTCLAASRIGREGCGMVVAVEPNPRMYELLQRNLRINWSMAPVEVHRCALLDQTRTVELFIPASGAANASLVGELGDSQSGSRVEVEGRTVDSVMDGRTVDLVKIDVEGHELSVLQGASRTLSSKDDIHVVMEWAVNQMNAAGIAPGDVLDLVESMGFQAYRLPLSVRVSEEDLESIRLSRSELMSIPYANIYLRR